MNSSYIKAWKCGTVRRMHAARLRQEGDVAEIWRFVSSDALGIYARYAKHRKIVKISTRQWCSSEQGVCECVCECVCVCVPYIHSCTCESREEKLWVLLFAPVLLEAFARAEQLVTGTGGRVALTSVRPSLVLATWCGVASRMPALLAIFYSIWWWMHTRTHLT